MELDLRSPITEKEDWAMKRVKIYGTLGPACSSRETLKQMIDAGMDGARLNLSHSSLDESSELVEAYLSAANECGIRPELLIDMQGPELRIGAMDQPKHLQDGCVIKSSELPLPAEVNAALREQPEGLEVLLDDGKILLISEKSISGQEVRLRVIRGGLLSARKSVALQGCAVHTAAVTDADRENIRKAKAYGVTGVMQPFVRGKEDLIEVRNELNKASAGDLCLFAKIENKDGISSMNELIPFCDEIVIARGDLGNAVPLWELPAVQKRLSAVCREQGRRFMVVTQMLDSMMHKPVPTRAEVSDIFNAVLDGASSVMVTGETAVGEYPAPAIRYLSKTVREAEAYIGIDS